MRLHCSAPILLRIPEDAGVFGDSNKAVVNCRLSFLNIYFFKAYTTHTKFQSVFLLVNYTGMSGSIKD